MSTALTPGRMVRSMSGAYRFSQTRLTVRARQPDGTETVHDDATVTVRNDLAVVKVNGTEHVSEPFTDNVQRLGRKSWTIHTDSGWVLTLTRNCGCG